MGKKTNTTAKKLTTLEEALAEIQTKPLVDLYPLVAMVYGVSRGTVYEMARRGEIDVSGSRAPEEGHHRAPAPQAWHGGVTCPAGKRSATSRAT
jgi:hypothetical protein